MLSFCMPLKKCNFPIRILFLLYRFSLFEQTLNNHPFSSFRYILSIYSCASHRWAANKFAPVRIDCTKWLTPFRFPFRCPDHSFLCFAFIPCYFYLRFLSNSPIPFKTVIFQSRMLYTHAPLWCPQKMDKNLKIECNVNMWKIANCNFQRVLVIMEAVDYGQASMQREIWQWLSQLNILIFAITARGGFTR